MTKKYGHPEENPEASAPVTEADSTPETQTHFSRSVTRGKSASTLRTETAIHQIVAERAPITVRGICYALFTQGLIPSMARKETGRISRITTEMRETGTLDWQLIVDGTRQVNRPSLWRDPSEIINTAVRSYRRDAWQDQPTLVEVWAEKSTIEGVLQPVLDEFGVAFRVMRGFGSHTAVRQAAEDSLSLPEDRQGVILYCGDRDPSGMRMSERDLPARLERYGSRWSFQRIAVVDEDTPGLPHFDANTKSADSNYHWYVDNYGSRCWELDALDPNDLRNRVREQIVTRLDLLAWEHAKHIEAAEVESMQTFHAEWKGRIAGQASGRMGGVL